jgi:hypothetical protein
MGNLRLWNLGHILQSIPTIPRWWPANPFMAQNLRLLKRLCHCRHDPFSCVWTFCRICLVKIANALLSAMHTHFRLFWLNWSKIYFFLVLARFDAVDCALLVALGSLAFVLLLPLFDLCLVASWGNPLIHHIRRLNHLCELFTELEMFLGDLGPYRIACIALIQSLVCNDRLSLIASGSRWSDTLNVERTLFHLNTLDRLSVRRFESSVTFLSVSVL